GHRRAGPHGIEDFLLREEVVRTSHHQREQAQRLGLERERDPMPLQTERVQVEYEVVPPVPGRHVSGKDARSGLAVACRGPASEKHQAGVRAVPSRINTLFGPSKVTLSNRVSGSSPSVSSGSEPFLFATTAATFCSMARPTCSSRIRARRTVPCPDI